MPKITDYNNWTYSLPDNPLLKDWKQLLSKLKTYITSPKFMREGSTVDLYDLETGQRIKRPITDVVYKQTPDDKGISSLQLKDNINQALITGDRQMLSDMSKYRFYSGKPVLTSKELIQVQKLKLKLESRRKTRRMLINAIALGGVGSTLGLLPLLKHTKQGSNFHKLDFIRSLQLGAGGAAAGLITAGLIEALHND